MKWVLDGRFTLDPHDGTMMAQPYYGIGMTGYDNYHTMDVASPCSNQGTNMLTMSGQRYPKSGVYTCCGEMDEPMRKVVGRMVKYVTTSVAKHHYTFDIIDLHAGDDYKVISIAYELVKYGVRRLRLSNDLSMACVEAVSTLCGRRALTGRPMRRRLASSCSLLHEWSACPRVPPATQSSERSRT